LNHYKRAIIRRSDYHFTTFRLGFNELGVPAPPHLWASDSRSITSEMVLRMLGGSMTQLLALLWLWFHALTLVRGSALTTTISANERSCFYAAVDKAGEKIGFYFAVQSGGSFDIDWVVTDPKDTIIIEGERERQGDYIFTADEIGEYSFCFSNELSSFSEKLVDFDIMVESEPRPVAPAKPTSLTEQTSSLEESIYQLSGSLSSIQRTQKYFRTRDSRNRSTVSSTSWRISLFAIGESALMIGMSAFQVWVVRTFFSRAGKRNYRV